jgi:hypothetical protein
MDYQLNLQTIELLGLGWLLPSMPGQQAML